MGDDVIYAMIFDPLNQNWVRCEIWETKGRYYCKPDDDKTIRISKETYNLIMKGV